MNVDDLEFEGLALPRFAEVQARLDRAGEDGRRMVLALAGLSPEAWERARVEYEARVADPADGARVEAAFRAHYDAALRRMEGRDEGPSAERGAEVPGGAPVAAAPPAEDAVPPPLPGPPPAEDAGTPPGGGAPAGAAPPPGTGLRDRPVALPGEPLSEQERLWGGLVHVSALVGLAGFGPLVIWLMFRDTREYPFVRDRARRAMVVQFVAGFVVLLLGLLTCGLGFVLALPWMLLELVLAVRVFLGHRDDYPGLPRP